MNKNIRDCEALFQSNCWPKTLFCNEFKIELRLHTAAPAKNKAKSFSIKEDCKKSLRKEILQPTVTKTEKPSAGIAGLHMMESMDFGRTDCTLPMTHALDHRIPVDAFVVLTDNETYAGNIYPSEALKKYRQAMDVDAKLIIYCVKLKESFMKLLVITLASLACINFSFDLSASDSEGFSGEITSEVQVISGCIRPNQRELNDNLIEAIDAQNLEKVTALLDKGADPNSCSVLYVAATNASLPIMEALISHGAVINHVGRSPLEFAIGAHQEEMALFLIEQAPHFAPFLCDGGSFLTLSVERGCGRVVERLLELGYDLNAQTDWGDSPLLLATSQGHEAIALNLIDKGADYSGVIGLNALIGACYNGCENLAKRLISKGVPLNAQSLWNKTPLTAAIASANSDLVRSLVDQGADIDFQSYNYNNEKVTPLVASLYAGNEEIALWLLERGADPTLGCRSNPPLILACQLGMEKVVAKLIDQGVEICPTYNDAGWTPLTEATFSGNASLCHLLIDKGVPTQWQDLVHAAQRGEDDLVLFMLNRYDSTRLTDREKTILLGYSLCRGCPKLMEQLVTHQTPLNTIIPESGRSPLEAAIADRDLSAVNCLIKHGADVNFHPPGHSTALLRACEIGEKPIIDELLRIGARADVTDLSGTSPLHFLAMHQKIDLLTQLATEKKCDLNGKDHKNETPLHFFLAFSEDSKLLKQLLALGADVNAKNSQGLTPLHQAVKSNLSAEIIATLLAHGAQVDCQDLQGNTPLHHTRSKQVAKLLTQYGANVHAFNDKGFSPIHTRSENYNFDPEVLEFLVEQGVDINTKAANGMTPLFLSVNSPDLESAQWLLEHEADLHVTDSAGFPPLILLASAYEPLFSLLQKYGATIDSQSLKSLPYSSIIVNKALLELRLSLGDLDKCDESGHTLLMHGCIEEDFDAVEALIKAGANLNAKNHNGETALFYATTLPMKQQLIAVGANVNIMDINGKTPLLDCDRRCAQNLLIKAGANLDGCLSSGKKILHRAVQTGNLTLAQHLLEQGYNPNIQCNAQQTPLHDLCDYCSCPEISVEKMARLLLDGGANPNLPDSSGKTPLHLASAKEKLGLVSVLIEYGADVNQVDHEWQTPLHASYYGGGVGIIALLIEHGAKINLVDAQGRSPLNLFCSSYAPSIDSIMAFIEYGADLNHPDDQGNTPLTFLQQAHPNLYQILYVTRLRGT